MAVKKVPASPLECLYLARAKNMDREALEQEYARLAAAVKKLLRATEAQLAEINKLI